MYTAGHMAFDTSGALSLGAATATSVTVGRAGRALTLAGTSGVAAGAYRGANLTVSAAGVLTAAADGGLGRVALVDAVNGSDSLGAVGGRPFLTITAALSAASSGVTVLVAPGTYAESITIPTGVSVRGISRAGVVVARTVSAPTDLVTMGESSRLDDVTLSLTATTSVLLRGVVWPGTTTETAQLRHVGLTVTNFATGSANTVGMHSFGTGALAYDRPSAQISEVVVSGSASGAAYGLLCDTAAHDFHARNMQFFVTGAATSVGIRTNFAGIAMTARSCLMSGDTADVQQSLGNIFIAASDLAHANAGGLQFTALFASHFLVFGDPGALATGTHYLYCGTAPMSTNEIQVNILHKCTIIHFSVRVFSGSATTRNDVFTIRKNGVNTALTATLVTGATSAMDETHSVTFASGDLLSVQVVGTGSGTNAQDTQVLLCFY